ncbi:MAG TPA: hypothetical protein VMV92_23845 [Streptosporangiaceae bacterium]|nr:hypothetical protein [Streptosporangiaceae bacterium]
MTRDYYGEANALAADLWEVGYKQWADKIDAVIKSGSTATEILMGIRWTLTQLLMSEPNVPAELVKRSTDLRREIEAALS